ncbi:cytochrome P450 [Bradyrhizobium lablabi]|uniref:cytochrome P450 n=1 Tax=Bradyrhizobium lablabi TaxID=722472 RepID=UPI001BA8A1C8|nr:cytochrome P450 [Bradyrhizobium lablabi]MBR0693859.1 cytochrome P450 [Bradyrhizobium lablabi]
MAASMTAVRSLSDLPSPRGLPLLGNALQLDLSRLHLILEEWTREFGSIFTIGLGPKRVLVCSDTDLMQTALRERPARYRRFSAIESVSEEINLNGLFSVEGEGWVPQRRLVMQAMASKPLSALFPVLRDATGRLHKRWQHSAKTGEVVDVTQDLLRFTVDVATALVLGEDPNTIGESPDVIQTQLAEIVPVTVKRVNAPVPLWRYFKLPSDRRFDRAVAAVHRDIESLIERSRRRMREQPNEKSRNWLEAMLATASLPDSGITDEVIAANVMTLLLASENTTAHSLAWATYFIAQDASLQSRLRLTATDALGTSPLCPEFEDIKKLDLFEFVTLEASRFKPVAPMMYLEPVVDVVLGDVALPAGTPLFFMLRPSMLDGTHFGRPDEFLPERWSAGHPVQPHQARAYAQFGAGPRVCPGRSLAAVEMRLVLSMLARNFSMELAASLDTIKEVPGFTMMPSSLPVRLEALY